LGHFREAATGEEGSPNFSGQASSFRGVVAEDFRRLFEARSAAQW